MVKKKELKLPTLKGKSKIKEEERLSSLEIAKEVRLVTNIVFWYQ
jgi:hypothetical protein